MQNKQTRNKAVWWFIFEVRGHGKIERNTVERMRPLYSTICNFSLLAFCDILFDI